MSEYGKQKLSEKASTLVNNSLPGCHAIHLSPAHSIISQRACDIVQLKRLFGSIDFLTKLSYAASPISKVSSPYNSPGRRNTQHGKSKPWHVVRPSIGQQFEVMIIMYKSNGSLAPTYGSRLIRFLTGASKSIDYWAVSDAG